MSASLELDGKPGDVGIILSKVSFIAVSLTWPLMPHWATFVTAYPGARRPAEATRGSAGFRSAGEGAGLGATGASHCQDRGRDKGTETDSCVVYMCITLL